MPTLPNSRHERFATGLADGLTQDEAYRQAGFKSKPEFARANASKLLAGKHGSSIRQRRDEILAERERGRQAELQVAIERAGRDRAEILRELWENAMAAKRAELVRDAEGNVTGIKAPNWAASNQALIAYGKEIGMFQERGERPPKHPEDGPRTREEVEARLKAVLSRLNAAKSAAAFLERLVGHERALPDRPTVSRAVQPISPEPEAVPQRPARPETQEAADGIRLRIGFSKRRH